VSDGLLTGELASRIIKVRQLNKFGSLYIAGSEPARVLCRRPQHTDTRFQRLFSIE
jgi:non-ribosomal peptide synthetase component F